jgi:hypothetical protein
VPPHCAKARTRPPHIADDCITAHGSPGLGFGETGHQTHLHRTQPNAARVALDALEEKWGSKYGAMVRLWRHAWDEFVPLLDYDIEIRRIICSTNAIESLNARYRRAGSG